MLEQSATGFIEEPPSYPTGVPRFGPLAGVEPATVPEWEAGPIH